MREYLDRNEQSNIPRRDIIIIILDVWDLETRKFPRIHHYYIWKSVQRTQLLGFHFGLKNLKIQIEINL